MNRLIIVGNGFDLAHGLKTSYCDFITNYLVEVLNAFYTEGHYDDPLIEVEHFIIHVNYRFPVSFPISHEGVFTALKTLMADKSFIIEFKSNLLKKTIDKTRDLKWVDLENEYFDELNDCRDPKTGVFSKSMVTLLNDQFQYIKEKLEGYLINVQFDERQIKKDPEINQIFRFNSPKGELLDKNGSSTLGKIMFLNFNYTNTLNKYVGATYHNSFLTNKQQRVEDSINYIHGRLEDKNNPIIFGFGDEYDAKYKEFELSRNNDLFRHIKSFAYLKTKNYHDLIRFLMKDKFQVFIVGHSCGLSDRTMFREIFSHENCRSIKVFYYKRPDGTTDFTEKTYDIARHFIDKGEMRKKIVPEPLSSPLPQYDQKHLVQKI